MRLAITVALALLASAAPLHAQFVVIDHGNLAQAILIAERTQRELTTLLSQYQTIVRMAQGLANLDRYRIPTIATTVHDASRWEFGAPWLRGLNSGDPTGAAYLQVARRLERPGNLLAVLPPSAREAIERAYATIEITDSVAQLGGHQVALTRGYTGLLQSAVNALESDVVSRALGFHETTAVLDKIAAGQLLARRQDMAANQLLSHTLEQLLARGKRMRDAEAAAMNMRLISIRDGREASHRVVEDAAIDLRGWRQP